MAKYDAPARLELEKMVNEIRTGIKKNAKKFAKEAGRKLVTKDDLEQAKNHFFEMEFNPSKTKFKPGDTLVFDSSLLNPDVWNTLSEEEKIKYYGDLGYGSANPVFFTFVCEHRPQTGHCVLINMDNQRVETMRHVSDFRKVLDEEC